MSKHRKVRKFNVNLYLEPPVEIEHRHDILEAVQNRLELYQTFGNCSCLQTSIQQKDLYLGRLLAPNCPQVVRRDDEISHWMLRLAYSTSSKLIKYFLRFEIYWFKLRWSCMDNDNQDEFWKSIALPKRQNGSYQVPFQECPSIVKNRNCILRNGVASFDEEFLFDWLLDQFTMNLSEALAYASKFVLSNQDKRLENMLEDLKPWLYTPSCGGIDPDPDLLENLPEKSDEFPLCMKILYDTVTRQKHLKYFGRLQLGLFLKGLGLSVEDALKFFGGLFLQKMSEAKFKKYEYKFKHMYGEVGSMLDYEPYGCETIQNEPQSDQKPHGCPFMKSEMYLKKFLVTNSNASGVLEMTRKQLWNKACGEYFKGTNGFEIEVEHPNQYYMCSLNCDEENLTDIEDIFVDN